MSRVEIPRQGDRYPVWYDTDRPDEDLGLRDGRRRQRSRDDAPTVRRGRRDVRRHERPRSPGAARAPQGQDVVEQLKQLADLHAQGILTDDEFAAQKAKLLG